MSKSNSISQVPSNFDRFVEVGRVVLVQDGPYAGKIAAIAEIIDHNRAIIDGPSTGVPRQAFAFRHLVLTSLVVPNLPRNAGTGVVRKQFDASGVAAKWSNSSWAKKREAIQKRRKTTDFERFNVFLQKRARRDLVRKAVKKAKA
ncbi:hypothetical protein BS47DRAFT_556524 [Hydnum rufescens UP504]|uniref:60S ribosomal protein L14 n=1 Tax=Hydnum rufescens UP504 TaxID=1448309 RepID=A0A9P6B4S5_9AGAM|nr:hypothetical protein BS47DRAFT_556524 [Hydnum rufescens UP504]